MTLDLAALAGALTASGEDVEICSDRALVLRAGLDDHGRPRTVAVDLVGMSDDALQAVQLVSVLPVAVPDRALDEVMVALNQVNLLMAGGAFLLDEQRQLTFRQVLVGPGEVDLTSMVAWLAPFAAWQAQHYGDHLEGVIEGKIALGVLAQVLRHP